MLVDNYATSRDTNMSTKLISINGALSSSRFRTRTKVTNKLVMHLNKIVKGKSYRYGDENASVDRKAKPVAAKTLSTFIRYALLYDDLD
jgi:hypothetical protein